MKLKFIFILCTFTIIYNDSNAQILTKIGNWVESMGVPIYVHGKYEVGGVQNNNFPLTTFDRGTSVAVLVAKIKSYMRIVDDSNFYNKIYTEIYNNAKSSANTPSQAKDAAFVVLMGIQPNDSALAYPYDATWFRNKYWNILNGWAGAHDYHTKENQLSRAPENIQFIQGYDYLKVAGLSNDATEDCREELFKITYELYRKANNINGALGTWPIRPDNNMTLAVGAAIGMGAIILHDRGTTFIAEQRKPKRWAAAAHAYINRVMWKENDPMGTKDLPMSGGYAEGPHYYRVAFENLWPFFQSFKNFTNGAIQDFGPYYKCAMCPTAEYIPNYYADNSYLALNDWYVNIIMPNGDAPTLDDTWIGKTFAGTALDGKSEHSVISDNPYEMLVENLNIRADYLAKFNLGQKPDMNNYFNKYSGDIIVRNQTGNELKDQHYIHLNAEQGTALNGREPEYFFDWTWGHEHGDVGNIIIAAGDDILAMDPPLYGDVDFSNKEINYGHRHNVITVSGDGPHAEDNAIWSDLRAPIQEYAVMRVKTQYWNRFAGIKWDSRATIAREIEVDKLRYGTRYTINDYVTNDDGSTRTVQFNLNGNGNINQENSFNIVVNHPNSAVWNYPCKKDSFNGDNWQMRLTLSTIDNNGNALNADLSYLSTPKHGNNNPPPDNSVHNNTRKTNGGEVCDIVIQDGGHNYGEHTRAGNGVSLTGYQSVHFKATIEVFPCSWTWGPTPLQKVMPKYTSHLSSEDALLDLHFSRTSTSAIPDTSINPLYIDSNAILETDAKAIFFSYSTNSVYNTGNCISYCNFRKMRMVDGRIFKYHDTTYLQSDKVATAFYALIGKLKYMAYIETDTACSVQFLIPDAETGYKMTIKNDSIQTTYNDTSHILTATVNPGFWQFKIELEDPCMLSCYFPPTIDSIMNTFPFISGNLEYLAHDLDIVPDTGQLLMRFGSKMHICQNYTLVNRDSIVMNNHKTHKFPFQLGIDSSASNSEGLPPNKIIIKSKSLEEMESGDGYTMIIVDKLAALVLDSGSRTHVGVGSMIWIKKGGTLVVRKHALLEVGDENGAGCVFIDDSAFLCVEDSAELRFYKKINGRDTLDDNLFVISTNESKPALAGVNPLGAQGKFTSNDWLGNIGRFNNPQCIAFCDLRFHNPPDVVHNEPWGYCNYNLPKTFYTVKNEFCLGDAVWIDLSFKSLNETRSIIQVFQGDTLSPLRMEQREKVRLEGSEELTFFGFDTTGTYYVRVMTINSCGIIDTLTRLFHIIAKPNTGFNLGETACPGFNTVYALDSMKTISPTSILWHVHLIDTTQYQENDTNIFYYGGDWELTTPVDTFKFPDFRWFGGLTYAVSLSVTNSCGTITSPYDTIEIQPGAYIFASPASVYSDPLGPSSLQLNAYVGSATSYSWTPTTYLDYPDSLNPIATPTDTITYILSATKDNCYAYDTLFITHNKLAFAGVDSVVCAGSKVLTGPNYDAALWFAILKLQGGNDFQTLHDTYYNNDSLFFNDLSLFMITETGKNDMNASGCTQLINYYDGFDRAQFYEQSWFITFYNKYIDQSSHADAFDYFATQISNNPTLSSYLQNNDLWDDYQCINNMLIDYYNYKQNSGTNISSTWDVYENNSWTNLPAWDNYIKTIQTINSTTTFKLTVIDNPNGVVEYDQVTYTADTVIQPWFTQLFQTDSTIYFNNISEPVSTTTEYLWDFGDGDSSTEVNPIHTFVAFDSAYVVTLSATNKCGTETWSDTVRVDSMGIIANLFTIKTKPGLGSNNIPGNSNQYNQSISNKTSQKGITCMSFPNPFDDKTTFIYQIDFPYSIGQLVVNNTLGQSIGNFNFSNNKGVIPIQTEHYAKGMYFYTLFIDGTLVQTGKWMKE